MAFWSGERGNSGPERFGGQADFRLIFLADFSVWVALFRLASGSGPVHSAQAMSVTNESVAVEDYLEKILELIDEKGYARVADVAEGLGIAQPSVSNMMQRLDDKGLIDYEKYRGMTLTKEGEKVARRIIKRHGLLAEFLELLGIDKETAYHDVEGMEHHISPQTLRAIEQIIVELKNEAAMRERVREAAARQSEENS